MSDEVPEETVSASILADRLFNYVHAAQQHEDMLMTQQECLEVADLLAVTITHLLRTNYFLAPKALEGENAHSDRT